MVDGELTIIPFNISTLARHTIILLNKKNKNMSPLLTETKLSMKRANRNDPTNEQQYKWPFSAVELTTLVRRQCALAHTHIKYAVHKSILNVLNSIKCATCKLRRASAVTAVEHIILGLIPAKRPAILCVFVVIILSLSLSRIFFFPFPVLFACVRIAQMLMYKHLNNCSFLCSALSRLLCIYLLCAAICCCCGCWLRYSRRFGTPVNSCLRLRWRAHIFPVVVRSVDSVI